jgi:hypothetical protein
MGFEPTIPVLERAKTVHALDGKATVIGSAIATAGRTPMQLGSKCNNREEPTELPQITFERPQQTTNKLRGFSPQANYTDQATAACRRS